MTSEEEDEAELADPVRRNEELLRELGGNGVGTPRLVGLLARHEGGESEVERQGVRGAEVSDGLEGHGGLGPGQEETNRQPRGAPGTTKPWFQRGHHNGDWHGWLESTARGPLGRWRREDL